MYGLKIFGIIVVFALALFFVTAIPTGPSTITVISSDRYPVTSASNLSAIAGNVTEVNFASNTITNTWQGYYGNVTGRVLLGNVNNQTLYDWSLASPAGQIYATRTSVVPSWASIRCANQTEVNTEDTTLGVNTSVDQDSTDMTFLNTTSFNQFYVGPVTINTTQNCRAVNLYNSTFQPSPDFAEVLLSDTSNMIYTGIITAPAAGFDNRSHQYEMIVGENGHNGDTSVTPYYFYLELH